jgi:hypothetical protein
LLWWGAPVAIFLARGAADLLRAASEHSVPFAHRPVRLSRGTGRVQRVIDGPASLLILRDHRLEFRRRSVRIHLDRDRPAARRVRLDVPRGLHAELVES